MPKNIVIFSDGTGQAGGIKFDEARTSVYKLFRACRVAPDTVINPNEQVAFYDPGLGSASDGGNFHFGFLRSAYNLASRATGLGITRNIVDCYAAIIRLYEDGDRIFLVGFSRGAYTVRTLAGVMSLCGVPRQLPGGKPIPLDEEGSRRLAEQAVKNVYQFCPSYDRAKIGAYKTFLLDTRAAIGANFRAEHASSDRSSATEKANVVPYCIGVFDTVAALGHAGLSAAIVAAIVVLAALSPYGWELLVHVIKVLQGVWGFEQWTYSPHYHELLWFFLPAYLLVAATIYVGNFLQWAPPLPGYSWLKRLKTVHFTELKQRFYDLTLNPNVAYARHAISIDENRADFARVPWLPSDQMVPTVDAFANHRFMQVWFPGVHADVGGGYDENNSRLSDIALKWMLASLSLIPNGLKHDASVLNLHPDALGRQHDEQTGSWWKYGLRLVQDSRSPMHQSVYQRFEAKAVPIFDHTNSYRPENLSGHVDFAKYFPGKISGAGDSISRSCVADDVEEKWDEQRIASSIRRESVC